MNKIGIVIFARYSSMRFEGKVLKKIFNKTLLDCIVGRIIKSCNDLPIVIATSNMKSDDKIVDHCLKRKYKFFRGSLKNVMKRAKDCCDFYNFDSFVRICCDRPFLDYHQLRKMINGFIESDCDIFTNVFPRTYPKGLTIEIIKTGCLKNLDKEKIIYSDFEHIIDYFYRNNNFYKIKNFSSNNIMIDSVNLSIDTMEDLNFVEKIYKKNNYDFLTPTSTILKQLL